MVFVNEVAEVVHSTVNYYSGSSNKNIGDAFLLVWKYEDQDVEFDPIANHLVVKKESSSVKSLTELAVMSFIKIQPALARSYKLRKYRQNKDLLLRLKEDDFKVRMGFGLHMGWAIEGSIGSKYKIDASYLSPHVNISARLEAATKQFGVSILVSEKVRELLREPLRSMMRQMDCVKVKGSDVDLSIFTIDLEIGEYFYLEKEQDIDLTGIEKKRERLRMRKKRDLLRSKFFSGDMDTKQLVNNDEDIQLMRKRFTNEFYREWSFGLNAYFRGEWKLAKEKLTKTLHFIPDKVDKPSQVLLKYMEDHNFVAPSDWKGVRSLIDK